MDTKLQQTLYIKAPYVVKPLEKANLRRST